MDLVAAAQAVRSGETTAVALLEGCLAAIDAHEAKVNATVWIDRDGAMQAAEAADAAVKAGAPLGPLHGVPLAHKDMYYQAGRVSGCGSLIRKDFKPGKTATTATATTRGTCPTSPADRPAARALRSPPGSPSGRWGPIPGGPSACPPRHAVSPA
jgi:Asp-tRNA(Asn)/Glu-tRNA(Gln) amidotransferase A subunit family amidase